MLMVLNSTTGSSLPSGATGVVQKYFHITSDELLVLPVSIYLIGYILGPLIFAPLSETYGRKIVMICTFTFFTAFVMATALAPSFAGYVVFRLLAGIGASTPVSVIGGIYADLYSTPRARGFAITAFMAGTTWGPLCGPLISGYVSEGVSWQWVYWIELILAGVTWPFLLFMPETYGPVILKRKAKKMRKETGNPNIVAPSELEKQDLWEMVAVVLTRPVRMFLFEAIVLCVCLYLSLAYGIFYSTCAILLLPINYC
jgi:multidrug resistance protein